jgi:class 3 adenylate cyclase
VRDGDVFGPVVNLAARAVKVAAPAEVVATAAIVSAAGARSEPLGEQRLKGIDGRIELRRVVGLRTRPSPG